MNVTLNRKDPVPVEGDPVPAGWNYLFFANMVRTEELAEDGTIADSQFEISTDLPLRWLAGSRARYFRPMRIGSRVGQVSEIVSVVSKVGSTGRLLFATQRQMISDEHGPLMEEEWDVVYREAVKKENPRSGGKVFSNQYDFEKSFELNTALLFRFSALNFNPRRLHYDYDYAVRIEKLPGLVVHGPLTGILLLEAARDNNPRSRISSFRMQAQAPVLSDQVLRVCGSLTGEGNACDLWAVLPDNTVAMTGHVTFE